MKIIYAITLFTFLLQLFGCKNQVVESAKTVLFKIDVDNYTEVIDLELSDLADSIRIIALETTTQSLLSNAYFNVCKDYIIAVSQNEFYKFSADGKFIKKIINKGRGPQEISFMNNHCLDEKNNLLYINDAQHERYLLVYDIVSDKFLDPVKRSISGFWSSFSIYNDSLLIGTYYRPLKSGSIPDAIFIQNIKGELLTRIPNPKKMLYGPKKEEGFQQLSLWDNEDGYYIKFLKDDTLFILKNNKLIPYLSLHFNNPLENPPTDFIKEGNHSFSINIVSPGFLILGIRITKDVTYFFSETASWSTKRSYFLFNKLNGNSAKIKSYTDNLTGRVQDYKSDAINFPQVLSNGKLIVVYKPSEIKEALAKGFSNQDFPASVLEQLKKINENLTEMDNPILLIGKIKNKI